MEWGEGVSPSWGLLRDASDQVDQPGLGWDFGIRCTRRERGPRMINWCDIILYVSCHKYIFTNEYHLITSLNKQDVG